LCDDAASHYASNRANAPVHEGRRKELEVTIVNPVLTDMQPLIAHMLECEIKLEQEAIGFAPESSGWGANRICDIIKSS
jgi:hypothetical protein